MFCPKCGQQQANDAVRFCSRCGFAMEGVVALVAGVGHFLGPTTGGRRLTKRQRGLRKGLLVMAGALALSFLTILVAASIDDEFLVFLPFLGMAFVFGLLRMLYGLLLEHDEAAPRGKKNQTPAASTNPFPMAGARGGELPPARSVPASAYAPRADTAEIIEPPPSVTDGTTKLL